MTTYTLPSNTTSTITGMMQWANVQVNGVMGYGILLIVFAMVFMGTKRFGANLDQALLAGTMVTTIVCGALTIMEVTSGLTLFLCASTLAFAFIYTYHS